MSVEMKYCNKKMIEIDGEKIELISPSNFEELSKAYRILENLNDYFNILMKDDNGDEILKYINLQTEYIKEFINTLGDFDNTLLIKNINYMAGKYNMLMKDIESVLGLSAGYISRTSNENAKKKLSIDVVWKIAKLFDVTLADLIENDLSVDNSNKALICKFIDKLSKQTLDYEISWNDAGGYYCDMDEEIYFKNYFEETEPLLYRYKKHSDSMLNRPILVSHGFDGDTLVLVSYINTKTKVENYDFYFLTQENPYDYNDFNLHKIFYTFDDETGSMQNCVKRLLQVIDKINSDAFLEINMRNYLEKYVKGDKNGN